MRIEFLAFAGVLTAFALQDRAQDSAGPEVGKPAPTFRLNDHEGAAVSVGGATDKWTVVAFYPKAMTGG